MDSIIFFSQCRGKIDRISIALVYIYCLLSALLSITPSIYLYTHNYIHLLKQGVHQQTKKKQSARLPYMELLARGSRQQLRDTSSYISGYTFPSLLIFNSAIPPTVWAISRLENERHSGFRGRARTSTVDAFVAFFFFTSLRKLRNTCR